MIYIVRKYQQHTRVTECGGTVHWKLISWEYWRRAGRKYGLGVSAMTVHTLVAILLDILWFSSSVLCQNVSHNVPKIEIPGHTYLIQYGRSVMLECHVTGARPMKIKWTKHGRYLKDDEDYYTLRVPEERNRDTLLLWIRQVWEEDSGVYKCEARNRFGNAVDTFSVYGYKDNHETGQDIERDYVIEAGYFASDSGGTSGILLSSSYTLSLTIIISLISKRLCNDFVVY